MITAVIMAGGKGERFWPKSRKKAPKQLINIIGEKTMIQETVDRLGDLTDCKDTYIITGEEYFKPISKQLPNIPRENILIEPMGKNTAACIGLSAIHIAKKDPDAIMIVLPSDHLIKDNDSFINILKQAVKVANSGKHIVTIGIKPTQPETGYGYINFGEQVNISNFDSVYKVREFVEKPDIRTAERYLEDGRYLWNSGMFVMKASTILASISEFMPMLYDVLQKISLAIGKPNYKEVLKEEYSKLQSISIDYGIMEHERNIYVIPGDFGWDDVGSWTSLERIQESDEQGNIISGNIVSVDTSKCIIQGNGKLIATIGLEDLIIVDTDDATLICTKDKAQQVKDVLKQLKDMKAEEYL